VAVVLATLSAIAFGVGDFLGGLSARRMAAVATALGTQVVGLVLILALSPAIGGTVTATDLGWGLAAGVVGSSALMVFYWALGAGQMSVVAPISAVTSALVPLCFGLLDGERPGTVAMAGALLALPAIVLISREPSDPVGTDERDDPPHRAPGSRVVAASAVAGAGFGAFFVLISRSGDNSGLWPLASARSVAVVVVGAAVLLTGVRRVEGTGVQLAIGAGSFDVAANALFLLASRQGLLTLVGVIGSMYPASTIVLARVVLRERIARHQMTGLALAAASLVAVTIG